MQHWSRQPRRIGPLITGLQRDPRGLVLTGTSLLDYTTLHANGTEYLAGQPLAKGPDIEELGSRRRRHEATPPDWTAATTHDWTFRWRHMPGPGNAAAMSASPQPGGQPGGAANANATRRLDDLAYGTGLWLGALRARSPRCLLPRSPRSPRSRR